LKALNANKVSDFFYKNITHVFLVRSLIKVTKYLDLDNDGVEKGPHKSVCIKSKTLSTLDLDFCIITFCDCLPIMHPMQTPIAFINLGKPTTIFFCSLCRVFGSEDAPSSDAKTWFDDGRHHLFPNVHVLQMFLESRQMSLQIEFLACKVHFSNP
jgi:hypothetical protein